MITKLMKEKIPLNSTVKLILKTGKEVHGILSEIQEDYVTITTGSEPIVILTEFIGAYEIISPAKANVPGSSKDSAYLGLTEDTVVERFEFQWQENDSNEKISSPTEESAKITDDPYKVEDKSPSALFYVVVGIVISWLFFFLFKLL